MDSTPTNNATLEMYTNIKANMLDMYGTEAVQSLTDETGFVMHWLKQTKPCTLTVKITNKGRMKVAFTKNLAEGITNTTIKEGMEGKTAIQIGTADSSIRSVLVWNPSDSDCMYGIWNAETHNAFGKTAQELASQMMDALCWSFFLEE
jgi:hypothetical protein